MIIQIILAALLVALAAFFFYGIWYRGRIRDSVIRVTGLLDREDTLKVEEIKYLKHERQRGYEALTILKVCLYTVLGLAVLILGTLGYLNSDTLLGLLNG